MNRFANRLLAAAVVALIVQSLAFTGAGRALAKDILEVVVANKPGNPVPVATHGRTILALENRDVGSEEWVYSDIYDTADCRTMAVFIDQGDILKGFSSSLFVMGERAVPTYTFPIPGVRASNAWLFMAPGTSVQVVGPYAQVGLYNGASDTTHLVKAWLYCGQ